MEASRAEDRSSGEKRDKHGNKDASQPTEGLATQPGDREDARRRRIKAGKQPAQQPARVDKNAKNICCQGQRSPARALDDVADDEFGSTRSLGLQVNALYA